jgi:hypothetical protein
MATNPPSRVPSNRTPLPQWSNRSDNSPLSSILPQGHLGNTTTHGQPATYGQRLDPASHGLLADIVPDTEDNSEEDDPLVSAVRNEPFRMMTNREENRRLRQEGHAAHKASSSQYANTPSDTYDDSRKSKRARTTPGDSAFDAAGLVRKKGDTSGTFLDPVQLGFLTEEQGRQMFDQCVYLCGDMLNEGI